MTRGGIDRETKSVSGWIMQRQVDVVTCALNHGGCVVELIEDFEKASPNVLRHFGRADDVTQFWNGIARREGTQHSHRGLFGSQIAMILNHVENGLQLAGLRQQGE
jgi:hypothetical protein